MTTRRSRATNATTRGSVPAQGWLSIRSRSIANSRLPADGRSRVGVIRTVRACPDGGLEVAPQSRTLIGDPSQCGADGASHAEPRALCRGSGIPVPATEPRRCRQLTSQGIDLGLGALGALGVVPGLGLGQIRTKVRQPLSIRRLGRGVEGRATVCQARRRPAGRHRTRRCGTRAKPGAPARARAAPGRARGADAPSTTCPCCRGPGMHRLRTRSSNTRPRAGRSRRPSYRGFGGGDPLEVGVDLSGQRHAERSSRSQVRRAPARLLVRSSGAYRRMEDLREVVLTVGGPGPRSHALVDLDRRSQMEVRVIEPAECGGQEPKIPVTAPTLPSACPMACLPANGASCA